MTIHFVTARRGTPPPPTGGGRPQGYPQLGGGAGALRVPPK